MSSANQPIDAPEGVQRSRRNAVLFVVLLGVVSLFADMTYEGARSVAGPYLAILGASGALVGIVSGAGELIGYGLRLLSGYLSDRTGRYWLITIIGYLMNLGAVPLLALTGSWEWAAGLLVAERIGKAIRTPARDAMLSHATQQVGHGWGFGLHEALDQIGAVLGPLLVASVLFFKHEYRLSFALLAVPAALAIVTLLIARARYPRPADLEQVSARIQGRGFSGSFWRYIGAVSLIAMGFADFPLIAYHLKTAELTSDVMIPVLYSIAMGVDALAALLLGVLFDRFGLRVLVVVTAVSALFAPLVFLGGFSLTVAGVILWGVGMGAQESIARAAIAGMIPKERRGSAYGIFNLCYGIAWFAGSALIGLLYDRTIIGLVVFCLVTQLAAVPLLLFDARRASIPSRAPGSGL